MTSPAARQDPLSGHHFVVEMGQDAVAMFTECSGLQTTLEVFEYKEGGVNGYTHKLPVRASHSNVTLKWGTTTSNTLLDWYTRYSEQVSSGRGERRNISIILYDTTHTERLRWNLLSAFPVKWSGPSMNVGQSEVPVQTLELAFEGLETVVR